MCYQDSYKVINFFKPFSLGLIWPFYWVYYTYRDAKMISVALSAAGAVPEPSAGVPRLSLSKESPFLPSLLSSTWPQFTDS